ncbi:MAG: ABC transporter ATP-binding protein [Bacteroidales bacterium]|nr:ABC transporter ATP-binding protein [Bacteroidales bacterium]
MNKNIISIKNLKRDYLVGDICIHALKGINLDIKEGEFVAIMGASGSGKSTLLHILGCLDIPTSGDYFLQQENVKNYSKDELAKIRSRKLGFVFQTYNLLPRTSALENVELPLLYNNSVKSKERKERAIAALEMVGLADRMYHKPNQLSGGQQQRVAIARSLINKPLIIFADEPTGNLDTKSSYEIMDVFQQLNKKGITIALVTHESDIAEYTKRNVRLKDGNIISDVLVKKPKIAADILASSSFDEE